MSRRDFDNVCRGLVPSMHMPATYRLARARLALPCSGRWKGGYRLVVRGATPGEISPASPRQVSTQEGVSAGADAIGRERMLPAQSAPAHFTAKAESEHVRKPAHIHACAYLLDIDIAWLVENLLVRSRWCRSASVIRGVLIAFEGVALRERAIRRPVGCSAKPGGEASMRPVTGE